MVFKMRPCCFWITFFTENYCNFFKKCLVVLFPEFDGSFTLGFTRDFSMVRRCDLKSIPFNLINSVHTWSGAVIKAKPLNKPDLEGTISTLPFSLWYVVFRKSKSSSKKSSSDMFLFRFPTHKVFNVFWELDSLILCYY